MQYGATTFDLSMSNTISFTKSSFNHSASKLLSKYESTKDTVFSLIP